MSEQEATLPERGSPVLPHDQHGSAERFTGLDGLRGVAALSVFFLHAVDLAPAGRVPERLIDSPLHVLFDGTAAVDLFFVLSGFVLALPFVGARRQPVRFASFAVRRLFRLYPAYWFAIGLALWFRSSLYSPTGLAGASHWGQHFWLLPLTAGDVVRHAMMIGPSFSTSALDPVIWSLVTEMRMSLCFPFVLLALGRVRSWRGAALAVAASLAIAVAAPAVHVQTFTYLPLFVLGAALATVRHDLLRRAAALPPLAAVVLAVVALFLYDVRFALFGRRFDYYASDLVIAAGAAILVVLVAARPAWSRAFSTRPIKLLGRVSYSFYLLHLPIMLLVTSWLHPLVPSLVVCAAASLAVSLCVSEFAVRLFELPFHAAGRDLARLIDRRAVQFRTGDAATLSATN